MIKSKFHTKRILFAWLLLALFTLPMAVKSMHVCQIEHELVKSSTTTGQHSPTHNVDNCAICHFAFLTFLRPSAIHVAVVSTIFLGFLFLSLRTFCLRLEIEVTSLRAPPSMR